MSKTKKEKKSAKEFLGKIGKKIVSNIKDTSQAIADSEEIKIITNTHNPYKW